MSLSKKIALVLVMGLSTHVAFADSVKWKRFHWSPRTWKPLALFHPLKINDSEQVVDVGLLSQKGALLSAGDELVGRNSQFIEGAKVSGSWIQNVYSKTGQVVYSAGSVLETVPIELSNKVKMMKARLGEARQALRIRNVEFARAFIVSDERVEVALVGDQWEPVWVFDYVPHDNERALQTRLRVNGEVLDTRSTEVSFSDGRGIVFPNGPKSSELREVVLTSLSGDGSLNGAKVSVNSALNIPVFSKNLFFQFQTDDQRFDAVQVYHYVDKTLRWFKESLNVDPKSQIQARIHIGKDGVSNAAFYNAGIIYLGTGDGKTYQNILKDPSIVIHETAHAFIDFYAGLPSDGEGGGFNEGFADFFAGLILDTPNMGEVSYMLAPHKRSLKNSWKAYQDFTNGVYRNGGVIGGTLWDIKERIGSDRVAPLAFRTLVRLGSGAKFKDFVMALTNACGGYCTDSEMQHVQEALAARGWRIMQDDAH
jgi:Zn-dependent metalloprotease